MRAFFTCLLLGSAFHAGEPVFHANKSYKEASRKLVLAAEKGTVEAQCLLGLAYKQGLFGFEKNEKEALVWITESAANGFLQSQILLAKYYFEETQNYEKGRHWGLKAAHQGSNEAMLMLANSKLYRNRCKKDLIEGLKWLLLAASLGDEFAKKLLIELDSKITICSMKEFSQGYQLAQEWAKAHLNLEISLDFYTFACQNTQARKI